MMAWSGGMDDFSGGFSNDQSGNSWGGNDGFTPLAAALPPLPSPSPPRMGPGGDVGKNRPAGTMAIAEISPGTSSTRIVGIVIAKEEPRHFLSKKDPTNERYVMSFTLRDSPVDFINATCWGGETYAKELSSLFHIGDVVEIENAGIQSKPLDGSDEKFRPWTPSMYQLNLSEHRSTVRLYTGWETGEYSQLAHIPVKANNDYYTIEDILANGQGLHGESISLLAAVKAIGPAKDVTTKAGKRIKRCEMKLFDETSPCLALVMWNEGLITLVQGWTPRDVVLFAADVRVTFDDFRKTMVATATSKTIFTVNPDTREAHELYRYAQSVDFSGEDQNNSSLFFGNEDVDLSSIHSVYSIEQLKEKHVLKGDGGGVEHGITYAFISSLNLDGHTSAVVTTKCGKCRLRVDASTGTCSNQDCPQGSLGDLDAAMTETDATFDIRVSISDQTGTLGGCLLGGEAAERMLQCSVKDFLVMSDEEKTLLKWNFLLEKCKIYFKTSLPSYERMRPVTRILDCCPADLQEAVKFLQ